MRYLFLLVQSMAKTTMIVTMSPWTSLITSPGTWWCWSFLAPIGPRDKCDTFFCQYRVWQKQPWHLHYCHGHHQGHPHLPGGAALFQPPMLLPVMWYQLWYQFFTVLSLPKTTWTLPCLPWTLWRTSQGTPGSSWESSSSLRCDTSKPMISSWKMSWWGLLTWEIDLGGWPQRSQWNIHVWPIKITNIIIENVMVGSSYPGGWPQRLTSEVMMKSKCDLLKQMILSRWIWQWGVWTSEANLRGHDEISNCDLSKPMLSLWELPW